MNLVELLNNFVIEYEGKKIDLNKVEICKKPIEQNSIICKYAVRYWDDKEGKWKYYRFGGIFGDKEDCQRYTYTDARKILDFFTTRQKLEIVDITKDKNNFVLGYINIFGKINYIKSLLKVSCWTTDKIEGAQYFTKIGAIQALEKILQMNMVNFKNIEIEPFIINLTKMKKE